ncbi:TauD/TfdA family dioxygenase [Saccharopolyspora sp. SCSIO 74807]|uniref:TauD/TfdA family dioxygenase n=1 Tax=Saccharopolyspora sp. SCSIO 74807 TaxID=3118084 RepID=UPI0030CC6FC6
MLDSGKSLPAPPTDVTLPNRDPVAAFAGEPLEVLRANGMLTVQFDHPLTDEEFLALGAELGTAAAETAPAVREQVEHEVILNLVSRYQRTDDNDLQPFARNYLSLHTEGSGRLLPEQPRYIVLMCCEPGDDTSAAQTTVVPMREVADRLSPRQREVLSATSYRGKDHAVLRFEGDRPIFSFRDFLGSTMEWTCTADTEPPEVDEAIRALLAAMYDESTGIRGVRWSRGLLLVIDNARVFHGRTAGSDGGSVRTRHLKRLRIN